MDLTVAICTRNRAPSLRRMLNSLANIEIPNGLEWEVVVVDNGSSDDTASVIKASAGMLPIRHEIEPTPGVSHARNRAVALAGGKYIVWTDDDVIVDRNWLSAYVSAFTRWPETDLFGGKIVPVFEGPTPVWLKDVLPVVGSAFAMRDLGARELELRDSDTLPYGANYALRAAQHRANPFRLDLGPGTDLYGEESEVMRSVLGGGKTWRWIPESKVQHCIPPERITLDYIDHFFSRYGRSLAHIEQWTGPQLLGAPRWLWRRLCADAARYGVRRLTSPPQRWVEARVTYVITRGKIQYCRRQNANLKN